MKCNRCDKEAEYVVDGQSVCKDHRRTAPKVQESEMTAGEKMIGL